MAPYGWKVTDRGSVDIAYGSAFRSPGSIILTNAAPHPPVSSGRHPKACLSSCVPTTTVSSVYEVLTLLISDRGRVHPRSPARDKPAYRLRPSARTSSTSLKKSLDRAAGAANRRTDDALELAVWASSSRVRLDDVGRPKRSNSPRSNDLCLARLRGNRAGNG